MATESPQNILGSGETPQTTNFFENSSKVLQEKSCKNGSFVGFPQSEPFVRFPIRNQGVSWSAGDCGLIFYVNYGYLINSLNFQIHFKIGDSSLKERIHEGIKKY